MPWVIEGEHDGTFTDIAVEVVVTRDRETYDRTPTQQFGSQPDYSQYFMRAEFNVGRLYIRLLEPHATLPSRLWDSDIFCDRFKSILEEIEPGPHRFVPLDLRQPDGVTLWPEQYWLWRCEHFVDAIVPGIGDGDPHRSGGLTWNVEHAAIGDEEGNPFMAGDPIWRHQPVLDASAIVGKHAWRDNGFLLKHEIRYLFLSDDFVARLRLVDAVSGLHLRYVPVSGLPASRCAIEGGKSRRELTLERLRRNRDNSGV